MGNEISYPLKPFLVESDKDRLKISDLAQKNFWITCMGYKVPFWQFFEKGWDGRALLVRPLKMHHSIWKILFVLSADEYLERLEGKIRKCLFFYVKIF